MAKRINAKLVMGLLGKGMSVREIYKTRRISRQSTKKVLDVMSSTGLTWDEASKMDVAAVLDLLFPQQAQEKAAVLSGREIAASKLPFVYSHSIRRESLLAYLVVSRPQKTDATALGGTPRQQTGTALLSSMKLKFNSVVLSFIFVPVAGCGAKKVDSIPKSVQLDLKSGLPPA